MKPLESSSNVTQVLDGSFEKMVETVWTGGLCAR